MTRLTTAQRGYGSKWQRLRRVYLRTHPLCTMCEQEGRVTLAQAVDHRIPHKGDPVLMWDMENNWQSLCLEHHNKDKQRLDLKGYLPDVGPDGWPLDQRHPANTTPGGRSENFKPRVA